MRNRVLVYRNLCILLPMILLLMSCSHNKQNPDEVNNFIPNNSILENNLQTAPSVDSILNTITPTEKNVLSTKQVTSLFAIQQAPIISPTSINNLTPIFILHKDVKSATWAGDGNKVAICISDQDRIGTYILDVEQFEFLDFYENMTGNLLFSPSMRFLVSIDNTINLWDMETHELKNSYEGNGDKFVEFMPNDTLIISSSFPSSNYTNVRIWDPLQDKSSDLFQLNGIAYDANYESISSLYSLSIDDEGEDSIHIFNTQTNQEICVIPDNNYLRFNSRKDEAFVRGIDGISIWNISSCTKTRDIITIEAIPNQFSINPTGKVLFLNNEKEKITYINTSNGSISSFLSPYTYTNMIEVNSQNNLLYTYSYNDAYTAFSFAIWGISSSEFSPIEIYSSDTISLAIE